MFLSEDEARRVLFTEGARPSLKSFQRYRRELNLPHYLFGKKCIYELRELEAWIKENGRPSQPE
jgi:hypothetical protein